jgi:hypothetical protein
MDTDFWKALPVKSGNLSYHFIHFMQIIHFIHLFTCE